MMVIVMALDLVVKIVMFLLVLEGDTLKIILVKGCRIKLLNRYSRALGGGGVEERMFS